MARGCLVADGVKLGAGTRLAEFERVSVRKRTEGGHSGKSKVEGEKAAQRKVQQNEEKVDGADQNLSEEDEKLEDSDQNGSEDGDGKVEIVDKTDGEESDEDSEFEEAEASKQFSESGPKITP